MERLKRFGRGRKKANWLDDESIQIAVRFPIVNKSKHNLRK